MVMVMGNIALLAGGEIFTVAITITHDSMNADDVLISVLSVHYFDQYLLAPATASYHIGDDGMGEYGMCSKKLPEWNQ